jgi:predicted transposase/invertase (TIGR01784 family)
MTCLIDWVKDHKDLQRAFFVFINRIYFKGRVDVDKLYREAEDGNEVTAMLQKNVDKWIEEWKAEGEARGEARGEIKGIQKIAKRLLAAGMPISQVSDITNLSEDELQELRDSVAN